MLQSKTVEEAVKTEKGDTWELTQEEMDSILLPTPVEYREEVMASLIKHIENTEKYGIQDRTCLRITIDTKTGEAMYD